jgi:arabinoxylan arabinofuranohydrolase
MKRFGVGSALVLLLMVFLVGSVFSGNSDNDQGLGEDSAVVADLASLFTGLEIAPAYKPLGKHNPILPHRFGADPYALVYDGRVYVYATNDALFRTPKGTVIENQYGLIRSISLVSSDDLVNWTDHGWIEIGPVGRGLATWAGNSWAPAAIYKEVDGKNRFFLYFANNANGIGLLLSDSPVGPFVDPIGRALVSRETANANVEWLFDPAVVLDDEGNGYLYFGGGVPRGQDEMPNTGRVVKLGDDLISLAGIPQLVQAPWFFEAAFTFKLGDTYYYTYCTNFADRSHAKGDVVNDPGEIAYMTSKNPMGPWEYQGSIFKNPGTFFGRGGNNHHSIIEFNGEWYLFYHSLLMETYMGIEAGYRATHVDKLTITEDGRIMPVTGTYDGVDQVKHLDPYQLHEAETFAWAGGITVKQSTEPSALYGPVNTVVAVGHGSFIGLSGVDFGADGAGKITVKVASEAGSNALKITTGKPENQAYGYLVIPDTGSLEDFVEVTVELIQPITGVNDLFFVFAGEGFDFDAWQFHK